MIEDDFSSTLIKLVEQCYRNSQKAQKELYRIYAPAMYNASFRIVSDRFIAEDIMQESFITAFEKIKDCKTPKYFGSWLKKIVINKSIDELRKRKINFVSLEEANITADNSVDFFLEEEEMEQAKMLEFIKKAIGYLPDGYRIVLTLKLIEDYDYTYIANELRIAESSVRSQYVRAKQKLLEIIENLKKSK
jgi:RNA polymerase sigma factor (sigma-70 family)